MLKIMPHCLDHKYITELAIEKLCKELRNFNDLCLLLGEGNKEVLIQHVCEPDSEGKKDMVIELKEYCICGHKKVDVEKCLDYMQRRTELEKRLKHADYHEERKRIQRELSKIPKCKKRYDKEGPYFVKHHGGVNVNLWWYYTYTAARECLRDEFNECMARLARALHYAQDGPLARYLVVEGALDRYKFKLEDDIHDIDEVALSSVIRRDLETLNIMELVQSGADAAVNEEPFKYNRSIMRAEEILINALKNMIKLTAYTLVKFNELIRYARINKSRIIRLDRLHKLLMGLGLADVASTASVPVFMHNLITPTWIAWLIVTGGVLIMASQLILEKLEPALLLLKDNGGYERYIKRILKSRERRGVRLITREYKPFR